MDWLTLLPMMAATAMTGGAAAPALAAAEGATAAGAAGAAGATAAEGAVAAGEAATAASAAAPAVAPTGYDAILQPLNMSAPPAGVPQINSIAPGNFPGAAPAPAPLTGTPSMNGATTPFVGSGPAAPQINEIAPGNVAANTGAPGMVPKAADGSLNIGGMAGSNQVRMPSFTSDQMLKLAQMANGQPQQRPVAPVGGGGGGVAPPNRAPTQMAQLSVPGQVARPSLSQLLYGRR